jgi:molecular chaperone GrpE
MNDKERSRFQVADRRFWVEDETVFDRAEVPEKRYPTYVEELKSRTELAEKKLQEKVQKLDQDNESFRERLGREMDKRLQRETQAILLGLLEVVDNLERALAAAHEESSLKEGVRLSVNLFLSKLKALGIEPLDPLHQPFDPHEAEAVGMIEVDDSGLDHHVVEVVEKGFKMGGQLVRPARVRVGQYRRSQ